MTASVPTTIYRYAQSIWDAAKQQCRDVLIQKAKAGETIPYGQLTRRVTAICFDPHDYSFHAMLYEISAEEHAAGRGLLSALVVHAPDAREGANQPGEGFWTCAKDFERDVSNREKCWVEEVTRVFMEQAQ